MRQHKYRGYTELIGHPSGMVYGSGCFIDESNKHYVISDETGKPDFIQVKEIEDWTGLLDKNGKEIYEGDILLTDDKYHDYEDGIAINELPDGRPVHVEYKDGSFFSDGELLYEVAGEWEVIGNIYENPELLGVAKEV